MQGYKRTRIKMMLELSYILCGILIGFASGIFGIGGSIIGTPVLKVAFSLPDLIALASPLPVTIPAAVSGAYGYFKKRLIRVDVAKGVIVGGLPATILGAVGTRVVASHWLMILTGFFIVVVGIRILYKSKITSGTVFDKYPLMLYTVILGIITGFLSGFLAIGGGVVMVPAFILLFGMTMQEAAATSLFCVAFLAIPGTVVHWMLGNIDWLLVFNLSVGMIPTSYIGSQVAMSLKSRHLEIIFGVFLILFGIYFGLNQLKLI